MSRIIPAVLGMLFWGGVLADRAAGEDSRGKDLVFVGYARDIKSQKLLYVESHEVRQSGTTNEQRVVLYRCPMGDAPFARKELNYSRQREIPEFSLEDARSGFSEGLVRGPMGLEVFSRRGAQIATERQSVSSGASLVADAGFDEFIRQKWTELEGGAVFKFPFLVPSRLESLIFSVKKLRDTVIDGDSASVIRLSLAGWVGWVTSDIEVSYRKSDQVLMRYKGVTNIRNADGNNFSAQIDFPISERQFRAVDLPTAKAKPLVAYCDE